MTHSLVLPFDTDDPEFTRGVEIGMAYMLLQHEQGELNLLMHPGNTEMILRLGETFERPVRAEQVAGDWLSVDFGAAS